MIRPFVFFSGWVAVLTLAMLPGSAAAAIVKIPDFTTSGSGQFTLPVTFTAGESSFQITGYYLDIAVVRTSGSGSLTLSGAQVASTNPIAITPEFVGGTFNADQSNAQFVNDNTGLLDILYTVAAGTAGTFQLSFVAGNDPTALSNGGAVIPTTFSPGTITVVPEPAALGLFGLAAVAAGHRRCRRD